MRRRQFLAGSSVTLAAGIAGCTGTLGGNEFGAAADPWSQDDDTELQNGYEYSGVVTLPANRYAQINLNPQIPFKLEISANAGSPMDFYVLDQNEFNRYRDQEEFQFSQRLSAISTTSPQISGRLNPATYYVVFDNTNFAGTEANGEVQADYTVRQTV